MDPIVLYLAAKAREGRLVACGGAGLSRADDAGLPSGQRLGELLNARLEGRIGGYAPPAVKTDLLAVADAAVAALGGLVELQHEVLELADFTGATPNYGHEALALLLAEGAVSTVLLWNWDDCVERSAPEGERIQVARTLEDMAQLQVPSVAKIHGCATRVETLLITSEQLENPPLWTEAAFANELRNATGLFIGIGDVADYAQRRITQLTTDVPELEVFVVSPEIITKWDESVWAELLPGLPENHRIERSADELLDQLARTWARDLVDEVGRLTTELTGAHAEGMTRIRSAAMQLCGADAIAWLRAAAFRHRFGQSVARSSEAQQALIALGVLAGEANAEVTLFADARCRVDETYLEALILREAVPATAVRSEAFRRAERLAAHGLITGEATFVVAGTVIGPLVQGPAVDVAEGEVERSDVFLGPRGINVRYVPAPEVVGRAA